MAGGLVELGVRQSPAFHAAGPVAPGALGVGGRCGDGKLSERQRWDDPAPPDQQDVGRDQGDHRDGQQQHVVGVHLAEVHDVEERADPG